MQSPQVRIEIAIFCCNLMVDMRLEEMMPVRFLIKLATFYCNLMAMPSDILNQQPLVLFPWLIAT